MTTEIKELTFSQASKIMDAIEEGRALFLGNGSSRAVFSIRDKAEDKLYVCKVAADEQGRQQNQLEMKLYREYANNQILNPIYAAYRDAILICDYVEVYDTEMIECAFTEGFDTFYEYYERYLNDIAEFDSSRGREAAFDWYSKINRVVENLEYIQGSTFDNFQVGWNFQLNTMVAYDYGYTKDIPNALQVGDVESYLCDNSLVEAVMDYILDTPLEEIERKRQEKWREWEV